MWKIFERASRVDALLWMCYLVLDAEQDRDFRGGGCRPDDSAGLRVGPDLHCFRFTSPTVLQARLLHEQIVLRDFNEANCSGTLCQERRWIRIQCHTSCGSDCDLSALRRVRSTISPAHFVVCSCVAATRGSLHVSDLIHRL
jgi:hypothetical protein